MTDNIVEEHGFDLDSLCCAASESDEKALQELLVMMQNPAWRKALGEPEYFQECQSSLELVVESLGLSTYAGTGREFISLALELGFDTPLFRECYASLAKQIFSNYGNPAGLAEAVGFRDPECSMDTIRLRLQMMGELKVGAFCYDAAFGLGKIRRVDGLASEITLQNDRNRSLRLRSFFDSQLMIKNASPLFDLLQSDKLGEKARQPGYLAGLQASLLAKPEKQRNAVKDILLSKFLSEEDYERLAAGRLNLEGPVDSGSATQDKAAQLHDLRRWDNSRNLDELVERLKDGVELQQNEINLSNLHRIFEHAATRPEQAEIFANAVATLHKEGVQEDAFTELMQKLSNAEIWKNIELFVEQTDKLTLKLIPSWLTATQLAKGSDYLVDAAVKLPYRLWTHIEKLLAKNEIEKDLLSERVFADFAAGKVSAEHYCWLWKAPKSERRSEHLANSYLLFKTLHQDAKGNYLKSKRSLMKLLLDDEQFQRQVMKMGDPIAIRNLVRCIKHQPLLDKSERQSLLVKIVRHYPQAISEVEEKSRSRKTAIANITSLRSYALAKAELDELVNVLVPENVAAIEQARSHGDLRENSEFKYAKERQAFLGKRRAELEEKLQATKAIDFADVKVENSVVPGCQVTLKYHNGKEESFQLLGLFDSKPADNMIAYDSPLGKVLVGADLNDELQLPSGEAAIVSDIKPLSAELLQWLNCTTP